MMEESVSAQYSNELFTPEVIRHIRSSESDPTNPYWHIL